MSRLLSLVVLVTLALPSALAAQDTAVPAEWAALPRPTLVPGTTIGSILDSTRVSLAVARAISSRTASVGDTIVFAVQAPVWGYDRYVIARGERVVGVVTAVKRAGMRGKGGELAFDMGSVTALDGRPIPLAVEQRDARNRRVGAAAVVLGPAALLAKGHEMEFKAGAVVEAVTVGTHLLAFETAYGAVAAATRGGAAPTTGFVPAMKPIEPGFGAFDRLAGMELVSATKLMKVTLSDAGRTLEISNGTIDRQHWGTFRFRKTRDPGVLDVGSSNPSLYGDLTVHLHADGTIEVRYRMQHKTPTVETFRVDGATLTNTFNQGMAYPLEMYYRPATPALIAQAERNSAAQDAEWRRQEAEKRAERSTAIQGMVQATADAVSEGLEQQAQARAANAAREQAAADARAAAQAQRDADAAAARTAATNRAAAAAATAAAVRAQQEAMRTPPPRLDAKPAEASSAGASSGATGASTNTDANRCISDTETKHNDTFAGSTSASVRNGCSQAVDVRICLMAEKPDGTQGWNCGVDYGVAPQGKASHSSFKATGAIFVDARSAGSQKPLAHPPGYR